MADTPEEIQEHLKLYWKVGIALLFCTVLTVVVAWLTPSIILGLLIATFKAGLVAMIFMHLNNEKPMIYKVLGYTVFFAIGLMFLTLLSMYDPVVSRVAN
jgi:caa(3)-type oxidase subunit IV|tara:strand:- start:363 stop:662 length:300 start_codon:yes stop_codon:yes gene_type:complete